MADPEPKSGRTKKASFGLAWLYAVAEEVARSRDIKGKKHEDGLKDIDLSTCADALKLIDEELTYYRSGAKLAVALNCSINTATSSLKRLQRAGFLVLATERGKRPRSAAGGRPANVFRLVTPEVSPKNMGKTSGEILPNSVGNTPATIEGVLPNSTAKTSQGVSPKNWGKVLPKNLDTNTIEYSREGAGARVNARPAPIPEGSVPVSAIDDYWPGRAPEGASGLDPIEDYEPRSVTEIKEGKTATLADLQAHDRAEMDAQARAIPELDPSDPEWDFFQVSPSMIANHAAEEKRERK